MKAITYSIAALLFSVATLSAQENVDVKKETTTKKITVRDTQVETTVVNDVDLEKSVIQVEGTDATNQDATHITKKSATSELVNDQIAPNDMNNADVQDYQKVEDQKVDADIQVQRAAKAEAEKTETEKAADKKMQAPPKNSLKKKNKKENDN